jgi:spore coat polysaccharide biosynthesis predicted glycosyltransferase SpsG
VGDDLTEAGVAVIADSGDFAGLGHVSRAGAVAAALGRLGLSPRCLALGAPEPFERDGVEWEPLDSLAAAPPARVAVLDSYVAPPEEVSRLGSSAKLVLLPEETRHVGDACLRPQYWEMSPREYLERAERILVSTGGGDPGGAGARLALEARRALPAARVALVRGPYADPSTPPGIDAVAQPESLAAELLRADIAVCGAGQTMLEACASGTPTVAVALADDQRGQGEEAAELGAVRFVTEAGVGDAVAELAGVVARRELGSRAREVVDGQGALRIARRIAALADG